MRNIQRDPVTGTYDFCSPAVLEEDIKVALFCVLQLQHPDRAAGCGGTLLPRAGGHTQTEENIQSGPVTGTYDFCSPAVLDENIKVAFFGVLQLQHPDRAAGCGGTHPQAGAGHRQE